MPAIRVLIADSQRLTGDSLALALGWHSDLEVLGERPVDGAAALETVVSQKPDVALVDYWMDIEGPALTRLMLARAPDAKVLLLSWFHGAREIENAIEAGAVGFLPRSLTVDQVADAVRRAHTGENPVFGEQLEKLGRALDNRDNIASEVWEKLVTLTDREILVLRLLSTGLGATEIARRLVVSQTTVRKHIDNVIKKLDVHSQIEAVAIGRQSGLVQL